MRACAWIEGELARTDEEKRQVRERSEFMPGHPREGQLFVSGPATTQVPPEDPESGKPDYRPLYFEALEKLFESDDRIRQGHAYIVEIIA